MSQLTEFYNHGTEIAMTKLAADESAERIDDKRRMATLLSSLGVPILPTLFSAPGHRMGSFFGGVGGALGGGAIGGALGGLATLPVGGVGAVPGASMGAYLGNVVGTYAGHGNKKDK